MPNLTRRTFLGSSALAAGAARAATPVTGPPGQAPGAVAEPIPTFRYPLEEQEGKVLPGGSGKQVSVRELPISTGMAGVSMRLKPGAIRELHWHANAAEWAYVVSGCVRTTVIDPDNGTETNDFDPGDVWYFPRGAGHMLQGLGPDECHFILVFDDGGFSEFGTFSSTDWLGHTPPEVLAKCLGVPVADLAGLPREELYIVQGRVPPAEIPPNHAPQPNLSALSHRWRLMAQPPRERFRGGIERIVTAREFRISTTMSGAVFDLEPGALREPHWHPNADEWQYILSGRSRMTLFASGGRARTEEFRPGDVAYIPRGYGHYFESIGGEPLRVLVTFNAGEYREISLTAWLAANPVSVVADNFRIPDDLARRFPDHRAYIAK